MIGFLQGDVLFSDGNEIIINTRSGTGYQVYFSNVALEGSKISIYVSHIVKEGSEELYGFKSLRDKKMFELLISVKGVGPKSAFNLMAALSTTQIIDSVLNDDKKTLTKAPGVGTKAASQMILDLTKKIEKIRMYSNKTIVISEISSGEVEYEYSQPLLFEDAPSEVSAVVENDQVLRETIMACKELGFKEDKVMSLAHRIMSENNIVKAEQLVHLVLKEI
ncbi:Holliday junction DNA helicase RuvA, N-terminal domain protein [Bacteriovorax sp. BSW11_IV]|uniref:Holliday junction branch migration protein RuvA n=1 Tax=Bacteriovorax sp. BSW11_IV TaxID=1353529 RepID=UPI000389FE70|nr:Holliday junction branch migration protein RuvA [Bacteriovorax sp. BSW11_IV]EQC45130.1 Holliday junction DNA helicase RuvA, N-terminal domain protein [Bacteriovorax sp. BSW11_IV]